MPTPGGSSGVWGTQLNALIDDHIEETVDGIKTTADAALPRAGGVMTGQLEILTERVETVNKGSLTGAVTINLAEGNFQYGTVTGNTTLSFSNWPASGKALFVILEIQNGAAFTITWPAAIRWDQNAAPTLQASGRDVIVLYSRDGGTTIRAVRSITSSS
jgi:hypothetical protein